MKSMAMLKKFWRDEDGGEIVEYALVIGLLVIGIAIIIAAIQGDVVRLFTGIDTALGS